MLDLSNRLQFIQNLVTIADKNARTTLLQLNDVQKLAQPIIEKAHRLIILKARQVGISTLILANFFYDAVTTPNLVVAVVSHEDYATQRLFDKIKIMYDNLPRGLRPAISHNSAHEIMFNKLHSVIYVGTAGSRAFGRGDTIHRALCSEFAFWGREAREKILNGLEEAVGNNKLIIESTPNGEGNAFYKLWVEANNHENAYTPLFLPWYLHKEYRLTEDSEFALDRDRGRLTYTQEENEVAKKYLLTEEQIRWRRRKIADKQKLFFQEYPEDPINCFLLSGMPVFDAKVLQGMTLRCREPALVEDNECLRIWQLPRPGEEYIIGADVAEGMTQGWSAAVVLNTKTLEHVASLRGRWETNIYGHKLAELGWRYNTAIVVPERNAVGNSVINTLVNQIEYPNVYEEVTSRGEYTGKYGWLTTSSSKPIMIATARSLIETYSFVTFDMMLVSDLRRFRYLPGFDVGVSDDDDDGGNADLAMALLIALTARNTVPNSKARRAQSVAYV